MLELKPGSGRSIPAARIARRMEIVDEVGFDEGRFLPKGGHADGKYRTQVRFNHAANRLAKTGTWTYYIRVVHEVKGRHVARQWLERVI